MNPVPWKIDPECTCAILDANGTDIIMCDAVNGTEQDDIENAAAIVGAVNAAFGAVRGARGVCVGRVLEVLDPKPCSTGEARAFRVETNNRGFVVFVAFPNSQARDEVDALQPGDVVRVDFHGFSRAYPMRSNPDEVKYQTTLKADMITRVGIPASAEGEAEP